MKIEKITKEGISDLKTKIINRGKHTAEIIEPNETYFVNKNTNKNIPMQLKAANGWIAIIIPSKVAMPFPPLNPT